MAIVVVISFQACLDNKIAYSINKKTSKLNVLL